MVENTKNEPLDGLSASIERAASALSRGDLVVLPTETVYGLGADAQDDRAVAKIFEAKDRPDFNPLIVHVAGLQDALRLGTFGDVALNLAEAFWPGPLTLVVPRTLDCPASLLVSAGLDTIALRVPASPVARALLESAACPIAAPSANLSGRLSPTAATHIDPLISRHVAEIIDGGCCTVGLESTIVGFDGPDVYLLRPGGISQEDLESVVGAVTTGASDPAKPSSPGQLLSHYAPMSPVRLNAQEVRPGEALLGFGPKMGDLNKDGMHALNLSQSANMQEAAANLFGFLRQLDSYSPSAICVMPIPEIGLGVAINDRLRRAASPRAGETSS